MPIPTSDRLRWALVVTGGGLLLIALNAWWIATYRHGYPFNIDEAAYTTVALNDYLGLHDGGLGGWWQAFQSQAPNAPLVPALTSFLLVFKAGILQGFGVLAAFMMLLGLAVYGVAERLAGPRLGAVAGLVALSLPGVTVFSRAYLFALPAAALLIAAVYALLRSEGLQRRRWAVLCGAALGLMLLARTMTVAFVPGVLTAALLTLLVRGRERGTRSRGALNLALLLFTTVAVAAVWYAHNLRPVLDYLTAYGYGDQSAEFGARHPLASWSRWRLVGERMAGDDLLVPLATILALSLLALAVAVLTRLRRSPDRRQTLLSVAGTDAAVVVLVFALGYAALTSSRNGGVGFTLPLTALLIPLAALSLRHYRTAAPALAVVALIAIVNVAAGTGLWAELTRTRELAVPGFRTLPWLSGVPYVVAHTRVEIAGPETRFADRDRGWLDIDRELATLLATGDYPPVVAFASRSRILNTNTVQLAGVLNLQRTIPMAQLHRDPGDSARDYVRQLTDPDNGVPKILITMSNERGNYRPTVTQGHAEAAARSLGFRLIRTLTLPDGRYLRVWSQLT